MEQQYTIISDEENVEYDTAKEMDIIGNNIIGRSLTNVGITDDNCILLEFDNVWAIKAPGAVVFKRPVQ
jgi:hypothetical protein